MKMPVVFVGHGNPMNALADNKFSQALNQLGEKLPRPKAVVCVSAHWMTRDTRVTAMAQPKTIHDFGGFPKQLFDVRYPAPGAPHIAKLVQTNVAQPPVKMDEQEWGLDHGAWSVLRHMYPKADVPVIQLSLDMTKDSDFHFELGARLKFLRDEGVLILGSGNIVHNLSLIQWDPNAPALPWATAFDEWVKSKIDDKAYDSVIEKAVTTEAGQLSIPTWEHWYPLLYVLGAADSSDSVTWNYEGVENASISMRTFTLS